MFLLALFVFTVSSAAQSEFVFTSSHDSYYHDPSCKDLIGSINRLELKDATSKGYSACPLCITTTPVNFSSSSSKYEKKTYYRTSSDKNLEKKQCLAITKSGTQCSRNAEDGSDYCWQHKRTQVKEDKETNYNSSGKTIYTGPRGGQYYINKNGNKTYIKKKKK
jgi:hypothetical protein